MSFDFIYTYWFGAAIIAISLGLVAIGMFIERDQIRERRTALKEEGQRQKTRPVSTSQK